MAAESRPFAHVLVALDGSALAERILPDVTALARAFNSRVTLLRASTSEETIAVEEATAGAPTMLMPPVQPIQIAEREQQNAVHYLETLTARLSSQGLIVDWEQPQDSPGPAIVAYAARVEADLIAMTSHGRGGIARAVLGSVSDHVVRHAPCPVLLERVVEHPPGG